MIMIQNDPLPTGADKPLRITGDPYKVQVGRHMHPPSYRLYSTHFSVSLKWDGKPFASVDWFEQLYNQAIGRGDEGLIEK